MTEGWGKVLDRHRLAVLQFSGGKDSLACLRLLEPWLDKIVVVWLNTGDAWPEEAARCREAAGRVPRFLEVKSDQPGQIEREGWPVDVLPVRSHRASLDMTSNAPRQKMQTYLECCYSNIWLPLHVATVETGATLVIRGQKDSDIDRAPLESGQVVGGIEYWFPISKWTDGDVAGFLGGSMPESYGHNPCGLDCMRCTAFVSENTGRMDYLRKKHPGVASEVEDRFKTIAKTLREESAHVENMMHTGGVCDGR